jgi:hypothetical protein
MMHKIELTNLRNALADGLFYDAHREKIERLCTDYNHSIRPASHQIVGCNCFAYAFGLTDERTRAVSAKTKVFVDARFVHWLRATRRLTEIEDPTDQLCIALYYSIEDPTGRCKHAAVRNPDGRMISKWGTYAVFEHDLSEVPSNYGDDILFVSKPSNDDAQTMFAAYVQSCRSLPRWALPFGS